MSDYIEFGNISNEELTSICEEQRNFFKHAEKKLNDDLSLWSKVKVPIKSEFIDDFTEVITYEIRYRLYLSTVYELLGLLSDFDKWTNRYSCYYWEKDKDGNLTDVCLP